LSCYQNQSNQKKIEIGKIETIALTNVM
jgi:hypothetical protein